MKLKLIILLIVFAIPFFGVFAQNALGNALGKLGRAIEKRYKSQTEKERQIQRENQRMYYSTDDGNLEVNDIWYDCDPNRGKATVTKGISSIRKGKYDDEDPEKVNFHEEKLNNHVYLKDINIPGYVKYEESDNKGRIIASANCKVEYMEQRAFYGTNASSASITGNIRSIPPEAFSHSKLLYLTLNEGTEQIEKNAFAYSDKLMSVSFPSTLTYIGTDAFSNCKSLTSINFGTTSKTIIEPGAFKGCSSLQKILLPDNVLSLGNYCFADCNHLTDVTLPDDISKLNEGLFKGCEVLFSLHIPPRVKEMGNYIFGKYNASSMTPASSKICVIYSYANTPPVCSSNTFEGVDIETCLIVVPKAAIEKYKTSYGWNQFSNFMALEQIDRSNQKYYFYSPNAVIVKAKRTKTTTTIIRK